MSSFKARTEFSITLEIGGATFKDVVAVSATFGVNSIPTASVQVATGAEARTGDKATIHTAFPSFQPRMPAKIRLTVKNTYGANPGLSDGTYVIFDGYYAGCGYQRSVSNAVFTINLIHWIDDLNCSCMLNGNWFQGAPHDMAQAACQFTLAPGGSGIIAPIVDLARGGLFSNGNVTTNFWAKSLKPLLEKIALDMPHPNAQTGTLAGGGGGGDSGDNAAAADALKRMYGELPLNLGGLDPVVQWYSFNNGISHMLISGIAYSSFWSKLVGELGASFMFGVSPSADIATVFPYFGGFRTPWKTITAGEYNYANFSTNTATLIESVDIFYSSQASSNYDIGGETVTPMIYYRPWGRFPQDGAGKNMRGHILVRDPPGWLANPVAHSTMAPPTIFDPGIDTLAPQQGNAAPANGALRAPEAEQNVKDGRILDLYAEHWYKSALLSQRQGELSGILRFDIAPGSTVLIEAPTDREGTGDPIHVNLYGLVTQVSYVINAEQHVAGTSLSLISLRTEEENQNDLLTSDPPPLYTKGWPGGPLVTMAEGVLGNPGPDVGGIA